MKSATKQSNGTDLWHFFVLACGDYQLVSKSEHRDD